MNLEKVSGTVSHLRVDARVTGSGNSGNVSVDTQYVTYCRIKNRQVGLRGAVSLADGDRATVVGVPSDGGISALAWINHTTGVQDAPGSGGKGFFRVLVAAAIVTFFAVWINVGGIEGLFAGTFSAAVPGLFAYLGRRQTKRNAEVLRLLRDG